MDGAVDRSKAAGPYWVCNPVLHADASVLVCQLPSVAACDSATPSLSVLHWQHELHVLVDAVVNGSPGLWKFAHTPAGFMVAALQGNDNAAELVQVARQILQRTRQVS